MSEADSGPSTGLARSPRWFPALPERRSAAPRPAWRSSWRPGPASSVRRSAEVTVPRRLSHGTLTIGCAGPVAMELQHLSAELIGRINQYLGAQTVQQLALRADR